MKTPTPDQLQLSLLKAYTDKSDAEAKVKDASEQIIALRNLLTGYQMAGQAAAEAATLAEKVAANTPPSPPQA